MSDRKPPRKAPHDAEVEEQRLSNSSTEMPASSPERREAEAALRHAYADLELRVQERTAALAAANERLRVEIERRTAAEAALQEERDFANAVLDTAGALVVVLDRGGRIVRFNRACERLTGYGAGEVQDRPLWDLLLLPEEVAPVRSAFQQLLAGQFPNRLENYWVARDGSRKLIAWTNTAVLDAQGQVEYIIGTGIDVTAARQAEESLRQSEQKFRQLFDILPVGISLLDEQRQVVDVNPAMERVLRMPREAILAGAYAGRRYIRPDGSPMPAEEMPSARVFREKRVVQDVEIGVIDEDGAIFWVSVGASPIQLPGMSVAITAVDSTARKSAEEALRVALAKYRVLFESFPLGITISDETGNIIETNKASERLLGISQAEHTRRGLASPTWQVIRPDGSPMPPDEFASVRALREKRLIENVGMGIVQEGKDIAWISVTAAPIPLEGYGVAVAYGDVTAQKQAEQSLRESEERLRSLYASMTEGVALHEILYDAQGRPADYIILDVNPAFERITGLSREQVLGQRATSVYGPGEAPYLEIYAQVAASGEPTTFETHFAPMARQFRISVFSPRQGQFATVFDDISEQKQAAESLERRVRERTFELAQANAALQLEVRERERAEVAVRAERQRFNKVLETLPAYVVLLTPDYHAAFANRVFRERFGESHDQRCYEFLFHRTTPCERCETYHVLNTGTPHRWEWTGPDDRDYDVFDFPFTDTDGSRLILEMGIDITERNRAERALREANETLERRVSERTAALAASEQRFRGAIENMPDVLVIYDRDLRIQYINTATRQVTARVPDSYIGKRDDEIWPAEVCGVWLPALRTALETGEIQYLEAELPLAEGNHRSLQITCVPLLDQHGQVQEILGVTHDLTARRRAEETLRASEERLARAQEIAHLGSWELDLAANELTWSDEVYRIFGLQPREFGATYSAFLEYVHPDDRGAVDAAYFDSVRENRDTYEIEHRVVRKLTGEVRTVHEKCEHLRDDTGKIVRSVGMVHDITERKRVEELLRASEERFRGLYTSMVEGVALHKIIHDAQGRAVDYILLDVNPAYERITGLSRAQVVGQAASTLYGTGRPPYLESYAQVVASGQAAHFETYFPPMERHFRISAFALGRDRFATVFDDITGRKEIEREREQHAARLTALLQISQRVLAETTVPGLLQSVVDAACELVGARICIAGHGYQQGVFQIGATSRDEGVSPCPSSDSFIVEKGGVYMRLIERKDPIRLTAEELERHPDWWGLPAGHIALRGLVGTPLLGLEDQPMGLIMVSDKEQGDFTAEDEVLLSQLATVASLGLRHIQARTDAERRAGELDTIFAAIADGVVVYGARGEIVNINAPAQEMLGYREADIALPMAERVERLGVCLADGTPLAGLEDWPPHQALQGHTVRNAALSWQIDPDGPSLVVLISAAPVRGAEGQLLGAVATFTDVSELRAVQKQLEQVNAELAHQAEKLERRNRNLHLLNRLSQELGAALGNAALLARISRAVRDVFPADGSIIWLRDPAQPEDLVCCEAAGRGMEQGATGVHAHLGEGLIGWVAQQRQSALVNCIREDARFQAHVDAPSDFSVGALLAAPMTAHEQLLGVLEVVHQEEGGFDAESLILVETLAAAAAIALENIQLHEQAREAAVLGERSRLARELHDAVSQTLFSASVIAEALPRLWERKPERVRQGLEQLHQLTRGALSEMRTLLLELRPTALAEGKMPDLLQQLVDAFTSRSRVSVALAVDSQRVYPSHVQIALYRIVQEALNNVSKHARATRVEISLRDRGSWVEVHIRDDGRGFDPAHVPPDRLGLGILRERAETIGATLEISSQEGTGTEILVIWPVNQEGGRDV